MHARSLVVGFFALSACAAAPSDPRDPSTNDGGFIPGPDVVVPQCHGNRDSIIDRAEVVFAPGVQVRYRVNPTGTLARVVPGGVARPDGTRSWDFTDLSGDTVPLQLLGTAGQWFESRFDGAQYAARLDPRVANLGVYRATDTAVELLGVAGATESVGTLVRYNNPVALLRFPLSVGANWTATATTVDSMFENTPVATRDTYVVTVDARGEVRLPELTFPDALRLRVEVTQQTPAGGSRKIQFLWMSECYGEIARMTSRSGEVDPDFMLADEFRRIGL